MYTGTITKWIPQRAFGFIRRADVEQEIFFHIHGVMEHNMTLITPGQEVRFDVIPRPDGSDQAIHIVAVR